jgi:MFS family permease
MMIANYYCYDIPAALHQQMDDYMGKPSNFESYFSLLYTLYSIPNVILPFFGGYFVDTWGVRTTLYVFSGFLFAGQVVFAVGLNLKSWPIMFVGRVLYGFGGESLGVANSAVLSQWFQGKELAFSFGLNLSVARLGSVLNNLISPLITSQVDIQFALWFGAILTGASILCVFAISSLDQMFESTEDDTNDANGDIRKPLLDVGAENVERSESKHLVVSKKSHANIDDDDDVMDSFGSHGGGDIDVVGKVAVAGAGGSDNDACSDPQLRDVLSFSQAFWLLTVSCVVVYGCVLPFNNIASSLLLERDYFQAPESGCHLLYPTQCQNDTNIPVDCPAYYGSDTNQPPLPTSVNFGSIDCTQDEYSIGCTAVYCDRLEDAEAKAGTIMSIPYIISASLSPFLGALVDRIGLRAVIAAIAPAILIAVHCLLGLTDVDPVGPLIGQGLAYSGFAAVLWPSVPLVVDQKFVGLAFGMITAIQNCGLATFPLIVSSLYQDSNHMYIPNVELFFVSLAVMGFVIGLYLNVYDYYHGSVFNSTGPYDDASVEDSSIVNEDAKDGMLPIGARAFRNSRNFSTESDHPPVDFTK